MPRPIVSPPHCFSCGIGVDKVRLYPCSLVRSYTDAAGVQRHRTTPIRVCRPCAEAAITAVARIRASGVVNNAGVRPRPHPVRPVGRVGTAERAAERIPATIRLEGLEPAQALKVCQLVATFRAELRALPELAGRPKPSIAAVPDASPAATSDGWRRPGRDASSRTSADASLVAAAGRDR